MRFRSKVAGAAQVVGSLSATISRSARAVGAFSGELFVMAALSQKTLETSRALLAEQSGDILGQNVAGPVRVERRRSRQFNWPA